MTDRTDRTDEKRVAVTFAMRQGKRCQNYGPEHERTENENCIVTLAGEVERLRDLFKETRQSVAKAADADCVCVDGPQRCKYCAPHRALLDRIDEVLSND